MNEYTPADLLSRLGELRQVLPEMRLGQLIASMAIVARGSEPAAVWEMEDEELLAAMDWQLAELRSRRGEQAPNPSPPLAGQAVEGDSIPDGKPARAGGSPS